MRTAIFLFILGLLTLFIYPYALPKHDEEKEESCDSLVTKASSTPPDTNVIKDVCEFFDTIEWTEEQVKKFEKIDTLNGKPIQVGPWILIRGAERELDTFVNYWNIHFTTEP